MGVTFRFSEGKRRGLRKMGWVTTSLLILVAILILANVSTGFEEEEDAVYEEFEIRAKSNSGKKKVYLPSWAKKYTKSQTGCPCWWDLSRKEECACCWNKGIQCGSIAKILPTRCKQAPI